jgi:predicted esterase
MSWRWIGLCLVAATWACGGDSSNGGDGGNTATGGGQAGGGVSTGGGGGVGGSGANTTGPDPQFLPTPAGACPAFTAGTNSFSPAGIAARNVEIWVGDDPSAQDGPLIFYWHGTGSSPTLEPPYGLEGMIDAVTAMGGIVAAPHSDPAAGQFPWFLTAGSGAEDDLLVADEILGCAMEAVGIDTSRIYSIGMSAGGLQTTQMSYRRSGYLASVATYSGGLLGQAPEMPDPNNKFAAMIMHGGPNDTVIVNFQDLSNTYRDDLRGRGHFAFVCNHGGEHTIPKSDGIQDAIWQFFEAHPYGTAPSPFDAALPAGFPSWCTL